MAALVLNTAFYYIIYAGQSSRSFCLFSLSPQNFSKNRLFMCGIVGYVGGRSALDFLLSGLEKLEYRGYDSAGVALGLKNDLAIRRSVGKIVALKNLLAKESELKAANIGIGHTRWATHGGPSENNAHPHSSGSLGLVHNGIIENYLELKKELTGNGYKFSSETDTEVAVHLLNHLMKKEGGILNAFPQWISKIHGSYAVAVIDSSQSNKLYCARLGSPLVLGLGKNENFIASDVTALLEFTREVIYLEDGDYAEISASEVKIYNAGKLCSRPIQSIKWDLSQARKEGYPHFMIKEINEQAKAVSDTISGRLTKEHHDLTMPEIDALEETVKKLKRIRLVACGTAYHASMVGKNYIETLAGIPCSIEVASELRYQKPLFSEGELLIAVSQSGETADTLAAVEMAKNYCPTLGVTNVMGSSLARKVGYVLLTQAGPEISVASTKAFTTQVLMLLLIALKFASWKGNISPQALGSELDNIARLSTSINSILTQADRIKSLALSLTKHNGFFFVGRGLAYPIALEGALKLKEITYLHAEGYAAGELKHGPIALISPQIPSVAVVQRAEPFFGKTLSNLSEIKARQGRVIAVTDLDDISNLKSAADDIIQIPYTGDNLMPLLAVIPLQLLAYYLAGALERDIDTPRNLAKSVTVE